MPNFKEIKQEIKDAIKIKRKDVPDNLWKKIETELDLCEVTNGLEGKNNLQTFYNIWQKNKHRVGHENIINSWTAYALGLTSKKPDGEFLVKRRAFARAGFPDIDVDFEDSRQEDVFEYLVDTYGRDKGGRIGTHQFLTFKSCITRVTKALDLANSFHKGKDAFITDNARKVSEILSPFPKGGILRLRGDDGEMHIIKTIKDAYKHSPDFKYYMDKYPLLKKHSYEIEGTFAGAGQHAAGFVVSDMPIEHIAPLRRMTGNKLATQFTGPELETLGLIKFDILGLSTLSVIKKCLKLIKENYDIDIDITNLPLNDEPTFKLYRTGNLGGVFQCEQPGMQHTMKQIGVDRFDDIMAGVALYRPGPMDNIPDYCARKKGEQRIAYFHPTIEPFVKKYLDRTYGILCIHEDTLIAMQDGTHKKIKDLRIGEKVVSYNEKLKIIEGKEVHGCAPTRKCDGYKITLNNGFSVTLTDDHKVRTWDGMKEVKDLNVEKDIVACPSNMSCEVKDNNFKEVGEESEIIDWKKKSIYYPKKYLEEKRIQNGFSVRAFTKKYKINRSTYDKQDILSYYIIQDFIKECPHVDTPLSFYKIKLIEKVKNIQFYGMSVEDNHNLLGNGILISNCYQEQIMQICNSLANFSVTEGYIMIKAIGKKKIDLMNKFEQQFIQGAIKNGVPKDVVEQYWSKFIIPFANYGFNKAHACCYGYNSYITAYLKANYPDEFVCAILNVETVKNSGTKFDKMNDFEKEFKKKMDIKFLSRDVNKCKLNYTIERKKNNNNGIVKTEIRPTLVCKGLGLIAAKEIEKNQPFDGLKDFAEKNGSCVDTKAVLALATAGYFGSKVKKNPEDFVKQFALIRDDLRKLGKKGLESVDLFE